MGYTHQFRQKREFTREEWTDLKAAVNKVLSHPDCPPVAFEYDATLCRAMDCACEEPCELNEECNACGGVHDRLIPPLVSDDEIRFNGVGEEQGHETFNITREMGDGFFEFCKTARKPYDAVVVAVLALAEHFAPGALQITSDGGYSEWMDGAWEGTGSGIKLARIATDIKVKIPKGVAGSSIDH